MKIWHIEFTPPWKVKHPTSEKRDIATADDCGNAIWGALDNYPGAEITVYEEGDERRVYVNGRLHWKATRK